MKRYAILSLVLVTTILFVASASAQPVIEDQSEDQSGDQGDVADEPEAGTDYFTAFKQALKEQETALERAGKLRTAEIEDISSNSLSGSAVVVENRARVFDASTSLPGTDGATTKRDLISWLVAGLDLGELSQDGETMTLMLTPKFLDLGVGQTSGQISFGKGKITPLVTMELPEDQRDARVTALEKDLGDFDDIDIALTWSLENGIFGRDPADYAVLTDGLAKVADQVSGGEDAILQALLRQVESGVAPDDPGLVAQARAAGVALADGLAQYQQILDVSGFFRLGELIDNQPQLSVDLTGGFREELVGRDEIGVVVHFEKGFANVNALVNECAPGEEINQAARFAAVTGGCYASFLEDAEENWSKRASVKVEYNRNPSYELELPDDGISVSLDSAHMFRLTGAFGFDLATVGEVGNSPPRLDFEAKYENVSDDKVRNDDRLVGTLTYSQKLSSGSTATISLVYANEPEFLVDVNEELSARVGLKWSLDGAD